MSLIYREHIPSKYFNDSLRPHKSWLKSLDKDYDHAYMSFVSPFIGLGLGYLFGFSVTNVRIMLYLSIIFFVLIFISSVSYIVITKGRRRA